MHPAKSLKWDPASGAIAIRSQLPDEANFAGMAWMVATSNMGARNASSAEVADWIDVPTELLTALIPTGED